MVGFNNSGGKIKKLAEVIAVIVVLVTAALSICLFVKAGDSYYTKGLFIILGIITLIVGGVTAWLSSILIYGFGELVETNAIIAKNTAILAGARTEMNDHAQPVPSAGASDPSEQPPSMKNIALRLAVLEDLRKNGTITEEEFKKKRSELYGVDYKS